jgi:PadR family transcriptional regulator, regulatory protein PadR
MKPDRELLKGSTPTLILAVLADAPRHGYAVAREIERRSGKMLSLGEGSLYPALHALERDGLIAGGWVQPPDGGASKKVYSLTDEGKAELARRMREFRGFVAAVEDVLGDVRSGGGGTPDVQPI